MKPLKPLYWVAADPWRKLRHSAGTVDAVPAAHGRAQLILAGLRRQHEFRMILSAPDAEALAGRLLLAAEGASPEAGAVTLGGILGLLVCLASAALMLWLVLQVVGWLT